MATLGERFEMVVEAGREGERVIAGRYADLLPHLRNEKQAADRKQLHSRILADARSLRDAVESRKKAVQTESDKADFPLSYSALGSERSAGSAEFLAAYAVPDYPVQVLDTAFRTGRVDFLNFMGQRFAALPAPEALGDMNRRREFFEKLNALLLSLPGAQEREDTLRELADLTQRLEWFLTNVEAGNLTTLPPEAVQAMSPAMKAVELADRGRK